MKKIWIAIGIILVAAVILVVMLNVSEKTRPEPTPTATVEAPPTVITCIGGQVFLRNKNVINRLREEYNIEVKAVDSGSFEMATADLTGIDCAWPGSASAAAYFLEKHPELKVKYDTVFRTYLQLFTWRTPGHDYLDALMKAGLVYEKDGAYLMRMQPEIIGAMNAQQTWAEIGVSELPGLVNIKYSAPERSAGGLSYLLMLADYQVQGGENGGHVVRGDQIEEILPKLILNWDNQPRQVTSSPGAFTDFIFSGYGVPMYASSESLFLGWRNSLPADRKSEADQIVGIYPEWTVSTDHVLIAWTDSGKQLLSIFQTDPILQQYGWDDNGMRTAAGGINAKPGNTDVTWFLSSPQFMGEPKQDVFVVVQCALDPTKCK